MASTCGHGSQSCSVRAARDPVPRATHAPSLDARMPRGRPPALRSQTHSVFTTDTTFTHLMGSLPTGRTTLGVAGLALSLRARWLYMGLWLQTPHHCCGCRGFVLTWDRGGAFTVFLLTPALTVLPNFQFQFCLTVPMMEAAS